jgi:hypothetical protein
MKRRAPCRESMPPVRSRAPSNFRPRATTCLARPADRIRSRVQLRLQRAEQLQHLLQTSPPTTSVLASRSRFPFLTLPFAPRPRNPRPRRCAPTEAEQAQRQNDVQIATLTGSLRELDALAEVASLKQQIADEQLKAVLAQLELGNGAAPGRARQPQLTAPRPSNWPASTSARNIKTRWTRASTWPRRG